MNDRLFPQCIPLVYLALTTWKSFVWWGICAKLVLQVKVSALFQFEI